MGKRSGPPGAAVRRYEARPWPRTPFEAARRAVEASLGALGASGIGIDVQPLYVEVRAVYGRTTHMATYPAGDLTRDQAVLEAGAACIRAVLEASSKAA